MVRHLDSGYSQPHLNEHESQQKPMRDKGISEAKEAIAKHNATAMEKQEAAKKLQAMQAANQLGTDGEPVENLLDEKGNPLPLAPAMNTTAPVSAELTETVVEEPEEPEEPTAENPLIEDDGIDDIT